jgi:alpha-1,2-mannosyltransferase
MTAGTARAQWIDAVRRRGLLVTAIFAVAFAARLAMVYQRGGSLADSPSYDTGVYYAAADAFVHGRMPYHDFTLVHPPAVMLAIAPFAVLGRVTTDHVGFVVGGLCWMALGGVNALLVLRISRRLQLGTAASTIGALTYALWYESTRTEYALRLEPLGNLLVLLGLLAFVESSYSQRRRYSIGCGAALGAAASVKIWYAVPLLLVIAWHALDRRRRSQVAWATAGAIAALLVLDGPFFVYAPRRMWHMVVTDQFGRPYTGGSPIRRLANIASSGQTTRHTPATLIAVVALAGAIACLVLCALAWRNRAGRLPCVLMLAELAVLMSSPSFFLYYADYLAPALALTVAAAAAHLLGTAYAERPPSRRGLLRASAWAPVVAAAASVVLIDTLNPMLAVSPSPDRFLQGRVAAARCVQSDTPMALIQLDVLSRDLANGCQVWVDVIGRTYEAPLKPTGTVGGRPATRTTYAPWQHALRQYLLSGDALVVLDAHAAGIARGTLKTVEQGPALGAADGYIVHGR